MKMYRFILFDLDDTIFDFQKAQWYCFSDVLKQYNETYSEEKYKKYKEINHFYWKLVEEQKMQREFAQCQRFTSFFSELGKNINGADANIVYQKSLTNQTWLIPYATEVCKFLSLTYELVFITNGFTNTQVERVQKSGIADYFQKIIVSEELGIEKPSIDFFKKALKLIGSNDTSKMIIVGDSLSSDIAGANNAGIDCCWYNPNKNAVSSKYKINYVINDLRELLRLFCN